MAFILIQNWNLNAHFEYSSDSFNLKFYFHNEVNLTSNEYFNFRFWKLNFLYLIFFFDSGLSATRFQKMCTHEFITRWVLIYF